MIKNVTKANKVVKQYGILAADKVVWHKKIVIASAYVYRIG